MELNTSDGSKLPWANEMRYLGIFIVSFVSFRCLIDYAMPSVAFIVQLMHSLPELVGWPLRR